VSVDPRMASANLAAAEWDVRLRSHSCTDADRDAFKKWRDTDPCHSEAFERLQIALSTLRHAADHPELRALRELAKVSETRSSGSRWLAWSSLVAGLAAVAIVVANYPDRSPLAPSSIVSSPVPAPSRSAEQGVTLRTGPSEMTTTALPDGSSVTLNASTQIDSQWLASERRIRLVSGQALFRVAKDPTRPFVVTVGDRTVTALGTAFDIRMDADKVQVTLLEGRVVVRGMGRAVRQPPLELRPNQQLVAIDGDLPIVRAVDVSRTTAWAEGQIYFTDQALPDAVAEMNRYSARHIVIADPSLSQFRINGMFRAGNQDGFVDALTSYYPIDSQRDEQGRIVLLARRSDQANR
jgi:transmembrane sensor